MGNETENLFDLSGRVAVVTGGSRGLGKEMVLAFARHGADVVIASRKQEACEALAKEVESTTGRRALPVGFHAGSWDDCGRLFEATREAFGGAQILVNNAGMSPLYPKLSECSEELYDKVLSVNLKGPFRLSVLFGEDMQANAGGSIINVSSIAAVAPTPGEVPYGAAKAGLNNLATSLSRCFGPTVRVNTLMPGPFLTDISKAWDLEAFDKAAKQNIPAQRGGAPHEIVGAALFLASDAASYTNGAVIKIDGGAVFSPA